MLSSLLYILSFPNWNLSFLAWVALVPLILSLRLPVALSPRRAFLKGWLSGALAYAGILYWIVVTLVTAHQSVILALLCLLLLAAYLGLFWGAWAGFLSWCTFCSEQKNQPGASFAPSKRRNLLALLGAAAWVALEYLRTYLFSGFPWALLADSQVSHLATIQVASVTGVYGVSFIVVLINLSGAAVLERHPRVFLSGIHDGFPPTTAGMTKIILPIFLLTLSYLFGFYRLHRPRLPRPDRSPQATSTGGPDTRRMSGRSPAPPLKVALLQGNIDQYKKWDTAYVAEIEHAYEDLVAQATQSKPDLIIWPETSVPGYLLQDKPLRDWLVKTVRASHTSHLLGAPFIDDKKAYNSAFSLNPEGNVVGEYDKRHLVPFGEVVPLAALLGRFVNVLNDLGGFSAGRRSPVLNVGGLRVGVNICYEAIFPNLVRQSVRQGAEIIANLTNDGWYMKTAAPYQHWTPNVFRAVENHRWVLRADNTGISGIIDPTGRVIESSPIFQPMVITGTVEPLTDLTLYTRFGDLFAWACACFCTAYIVLYILRIP